MREVVLGPVPTRVGIACADFTPAIVEALLEGARDVLDKLGVADIVLLRVPGALELPVAALALIEQGGCEAVVAVGAVIKGETDHYEHVSGEATRGIGEVALRTGRPVGNAVLTVRDHQHAIDRSQPGSGNKGAEAALAAVTAARRIATL